MNLLLLSDDASEKVRSVSASDDRKKTDEVTTLTSDKHEIASPLTEQVTGDSLAADADNDSIDDDGLAQIRLQQIDKVPTDTPDSVLSTSDTLSSYSGCSVGGVGEPFVAVFGGVQEVSLDEVRNEIDSSNDGDSAVLVCSIDGSLCGSVASSQDRGDECIPSVNLISSTAVDNSCVQKTENNSSSCIPQGRHCLGTSEVAKRYLARYPNEACVKSSTALILECRPRGLPSKSKQCQSSEGKNFSSKIKCILYRCM